MEKKVNREAPSKWDNCSERALLEIWKEKMGELRGCRKNSHILQEMSSELEAQGYMYSVVELKVKMHNMTARYRKEKQKIGTTGGSPSSWDLFGDLQTLLAPFKSYHTESLVVDSINNIHSSIKNNSVPTSPPSSPIPATSTPSPSIATTSSPMPAVPSPSSMGTASSPSVPTSTATRKRSETIEKCFKTLEKQMERIQEDIKKTSERALAIEEEKKEIFKSYVEREAVVQEALLQFLKRD